MLSTAGSAIRGESERSGREVMRLIVGLGNPGPEYEWTPHNLGFLAVDGLAERARIRVTRPEAKAYVGRGELAGRGSDSREAADVHESERRCGADAARSYELDPAQMIVLVDDVDLPWGNLRIRERGSAGTHNGLKSIVGSIGTQEFLRIRLGVGPEKVWGELRDYVLRRMGPPSARRPRRWSPMQSKRCELIFTEGVSKAMSRFNRKVPPAEENSK